MLEHLKTDRRFGVYAAALALLALLCGAAVWSTARTGAWLTDEGDWQYLGGDYRIGTIDYAVTINDQQLMGMKDGTADVATYQLAIPLLGGVRIFDPTLGGTAAEAARLRTAEFNEGATLARVRIINRSDSMVEVHVGFQLATDAAGAALRMLPLPVTLDQAGAERLDCRQYVMDTLGLIEPDLAAAPDPAAAEAQALESLEAAYAAYQKNNAPYSLDAGIIPGALGANGANASQDNVVELDGKFYYFKDVFLLLWSEYGAEPEYNGENAADPAIRQGQLLGTFTVGQLE